MLQLIYTIVIDIGRGYFRGGEAVTFEILRVLGSKYLQNHVRYKGSLN